MKRYLYQYLEDDMPNKIILITGPRQVGKTTLAQMLGEGYQYLNYDLSEHREILADKSWDRKSKYLIFDEIHKMKNWKRWLKGIYDTERLNPPIIVTGSARLDTYKKVGDSLAGRYFQFNLHPIDVKEAVSTLELSANEAFERLITYSGFPEPFLKADQRFYNRWRKSHLDIILRQDLIDLETVSDIKSIEILIDLICNQVGSTISYSSLAKTLQVNDKTVKRWLGILENLYVIFAVRPYSTKISRSILKAPKYYLFDTGRVKGDLGARFENLVALALYKQVNYLRDCYGRDISLAFLRKKDGREIDFLVIEKGNPKIMLECKASDDKPSKNFEIFEDELGLVKKVQLLANVGQEKTFQNGLEIRGAAGWLATLNLEN